MKRRTFVRSTLAAAAGAAIPAQAWPMTRVRPGWRQVADVQAITGDGREITLSGKAIADLAARLRGPLLLRDHEGYDDARRILNPSFDKYPALIPQVTGTADVRTAVEFAREHRLLTAVKCGGHSASGKSTCDMGMLIDLSPFRNVRVDPTARRARVTGGSLLGQLDHEAMAYGLVTPMGTVSHTGVGGLVTGGGFGRVARRFGMSVDNLVAADVVTADGEYRRASADEHADLFWGIRGGGGNFGIVTSFEFQLHPMDRDVIAGAVVFPVERARDVLSMFADYAPQAPDELSMGFGVMYPPGGAAPFAALNVCYAGPAVGVERALAPVRQLGTPIADTIQTMDYVALQRSGDTDDPRARASYLKSGFIRDMPGALISAIVDGLEGDPRRRAGVFFQQSGGAISRVPNDATAFSHRDALGNLLSAVDWPFGEDPSDHVAWIKEFWTSIEPFTRGFYTNDLEVDHSSETVNANYRGNYDRLVAIKNRYDPTNLFRLNANVQPTV